MFFFSSRRRHTRCALVTGVQTCALPIYSLQGVAGTGSPIRLAFQRPGGAATGKLLPSERASDRLEVPGVGVLTVSLVDAANPVVFVRGEELGLDFTIGPKGLAEDRGWLERFEAIREIGRAHV